MEKHLFTVLGLLAIVFAMVTALYNLQLSLYIIGGVVVAGLGVVIYRLKNPS